MPREMHVRSLDGTRWTSTSSAATLKAPHGGSMNGLQSACGCSGRKELQGLGCGCGSKSRPQFAGLEDLGVYGKTQVDALKPGERSVVTIEQVMYGQPPLGVQTVIDQTNKALLELNYRDVKISAPKSYPLAWSWAWEAGPKVWTAYVSNPDAGPFLKELNIEGSPFYIASDAAPSAEATRNYPTTGIVLSIEAMPPSEILTATEQGLLRDALRRNVKGSLGTDVRTYLRVWGKKKPFNWALAIALFGGLTFAGKKLRDAR